jgi:hypothetical protein
LKSRLSSKEGPRGVNMFSKFIFSFIKTSKEHFRSRSLEEPSTGQMYVYNTSLKFNRLKVFLSSYCVSKVFNIFLKIISLYFQVSDNPTRDETEEITSLWQTGLWNSHIQADRFLLEDDRAIFMFKVSF